MEHHPNPQQMLDEINAGYKRLDSSCVTLDYPHGDPAEEGLQVYVFPDSFAHLFREDGTLSSTQIRDTAPTDLSQSELSRPPIGGSQAHSPSLRMELSLDKYRLCKICCLYSTYCRR
jgi:hypothetical protein